MDELIPNLCCPKCKSKLSYDQSNHMLKCIAEGHSYLVLDSVPLMYLDPFNDYIHPEMNAKEFIASIIHSRSLQNDAVSIFKKLGIVNPTSRDTNFLKDLMLEASRLKKCNRSPEIGCFQERFGLTTKRIANNCFLDKCYPDYMKEYNRVAFLSHNFPRILPSGLETSYNVRIRNDGPYWLDNNIVIFSYRLFQDSIYLRDGPRSQIPIPLPPGRNISIPLKVETNDLHKGKYSLEIGALIEKSRWFNDKIVVDFELMDPIPEIPISRNPTPSKDYLQQHLYSNKWLDEKISQLNVDPKLYLEIGCGCSPQEPSLLKRSSASVGFDISHLLARMGYYIYNKRDEWLLTDSIKAMNIYKTKFYFVAGDALNLPFCDDSYDIVTMYAVFHHILEPFRFICELVRVSKEGSLIALMCEPWGDSLMYAQEDLMRGIDEKIYSLEEYHNFFLRSQLQILDIHLDRGSLNMLIRVTKCSPDSMASAENGTV